MSLKITPDRYFILAIIGMIISHTLFPFRQIITYPVWLIGVLIAIVGYFISHRANTILVRNQTGIKPFERPVVFVSTGPFRFSRNPIYLGMILMLFGIAWSFGSMATFIFPILFAVVISILVIPDEEQELEKSFRKPYLAYKRKVRRWI